MNHYLNESGIVKVEFDEVELLLGPEGSEIDLRYNLMNARKRKGRRIFQIFGSQGPSGFLFVSIMRRERRLEEKRRREEEYVVNLVMWARQEECQEIWKVIKHMSERNEELLAVMERQKSLLKETLEDLRKQIFKKKGSWTKEFLKKKWKFRKNRFWTK